MDDDVKKNTFDFIEKLKKAGHTVEPVEFEHLDYIIPAYYVLTTAEASSPRILSRPSLYWAQA